MQTKIRFLDGCGNFQEETITSSNMIELETSIHSIQRELSVKWSCPDNQNTVVRWHKVNDPSQEEISLKVEIDLQKEKEFIEFLNEQGWFFNKIQYTKSLYLWRVDIDNQKNKELIQSLPYVTRISEMTNITLD
ncbi:hypothetical protein SIM22_06000 [Bacillus cereus group sp. BfR-BA-01363]|uniref:hypothetical protein n=1 Tax=Bacillus cereus group sp. BfR-BA-01363 TaxID=3094882 RepID=UPI0029C1CFE1|nr:hypothetical protein [Bacillus cereus group sp. BfR-BA-01363]MDX5853656.1 hypothetical protein [Bacillus cereus group sp. BfR-BA-01363]